MMRESGAAGKATRREKSEQHGEAALREKADRRGISARLSVQRADLLST